MIKEVKELIEKYSASKVDEKILETFKTQDEKEFKELYGNLLVIDSSNDFTPDRKKIEIRVVLEMISLPKKVRDLYELNPSNMIEKGTEPLYTMIRMPKKTLLEKMTSNLKGHLKNVLDLVFPARFENSDEIKEILTNCSAEMTNKLIEKRCAGLTNVDVHVCVGMASLLYATALLFYPDYSNSMLKRIKAELPDNCIPKIDEILYDAMKVTDWIGCDVLRLTKTDNEIFSFRGNKRVKPKKRKGKGKKKKSVGKKSKGKKKSVSRKHKKSIRHARK
jgi:hypothetical protein